MKLDTPLVQDDTGLAILVDGASVRVGESDRVALQAVGRPRGAFDVMDPSPLRGADWRVRGWATQEVAFGLLTLDGRVALATYSRENAPVEWISEVLTAHEAAFREHDPQIVTGSATSYWFWNAGEDRLMICRARDLSGRVSLTLAVGRAEVMDALRMNVTDAQADQVQADRLLSKTSPRG